MCEGRLSKGGLAGTALAWAQVPPSSVTGVNGGGRGTSTVYMHWRTFLSGCGPEPGQVSQALLETVKSFMNMEDWAAGTSESAGYGAERGMRRRERFSTKFLWGVSREQCLHVRCYLFLQKNSDILYSFIAKGLNPVGKKTREKLFKKGDIYLFLAVVDWILVENIKIFVLLHTPNLTGLTLKNLPK